MAARTACRLSGSIVGRIPNAERTIFLTIDDGPSHQSSRLSDLLLSRGILATWFLVGETAESNKSIVADLVDAGHRFGNHSYRHLDAWKRRWSSVASDLASGLRSVEQVTGAKCVWTRPPFGRIRPSTLTWCRDHDQGPMLWDVLAFDFGPTRDPVAISHRIRSRVRAGSIIAMHDKSDAGQLDIFERTISDLLEDGWLFSLLPPRT